MQYCNQLFLIATMFSATTQAAEDTVAGTIDVAARADLLAIADTYYQQRLSFSPQLAYSIGADAPNNSRWSDISPEGISANVAAQESILEDLNGTTGEFPLGSPEWVLYGSLQESLEARLELRVCKRELWSIDHMDSFYSSLGNVAQIHPLEDETDRSAALQRWRNIPDYVDQDISNLRQGVDSGYLVHIGVVERVITQITGLISMPLETSPLTLMSRRVDNAAFASELEDIVATSVLPALESYRNFLVEDYIKAARESHSIAKNPNGRACYIAYYRSYSTMKRTPEAVFALGEAAVERQRQAVIDLGEEVYGITDFAEIVRLTSDDQANQSEGPEQVQSTAEDVLSRAKALSHTLFNQLPEAELIVEAYPEPQQGTGRPASYRTPVGDQPGKYMFDPQDWQNGTIGGGEITAVHEGFPGHHMQLALSIERESLHPVERLLRNSAYIEGWARYAEGLAEDIGVYSSHFAPIERRAWPARGMVVDTGLHMLGWSDAEAIEYLEESGRFSGESTMAMLDRISNIPAQLTSYDSGALEIAALRQMAEERLGKSFDLKAFHDAFLANGTIPLNLARAIIENWIIQVEAD